MNRIESPYPVIRRGKDIDMNEQIACWDAEYHIALQASINAFSSYSEVSEETRNDFNTMREVIRAYQKLGYLDQEEADNLIDEAAAIRTEMLKDLEVELEDEGYCEVLSNV